MAAAAPQCGAQQGGTALPTAAEGAGQSGSSNPSDSRDWGVMDNDIAGRNAPELCEICIGFSGGEGFKSNGVHDGCSIPQQSSLK